KEAKEAIKDFSPPPFHYKIEQTGKCLLLNDCYNANPGSMKFALCWLKKMRGKRKIAVLGDMLELGDFAVSYHKDVGRFASSLRIDALFAIGKFSSHVVEGAKEGGLKEAFFFEDKDSLLAELINYLREDDCVLVKGSRQTRMEEIIEMLKVHLRE
ncbi:UDP-N-acetylmuramoyl-tripeptide--D-alanyl-D-alanine ligase, partial [Candidatus Aerophobetes bacterium]|nr:UDP-N-acetylmuramoyl-tripeptide--D-alanyl-D-alanine ligase [Candidatus Aerophobetes bacterium]